MSFGAERRKDVAIEKRVEQSRGFILLVLPEGDADAQANSTPAFAEGSFVALFRLLPEVEDRLDTLLSDFIPSADGAAVGPGTQRRARIRHFAVEIGNGAQLNSAIWEVDPPASSESGDAAEQAEHLGLVLDGAELQNSDRPMRDLKRPGRFAVNGSGTDLVLSVGGFADRVFFWAFDDRGLAVDPGAVADWWSTLAVDQFEDQHLWAPGLNAPAELRTVQPQPRRTVHLVSPNEGPAEGLDTAVVTNGLQGTGILRQQDGDPVTLSIDSGDPDQPLRLALLPNGAYASQLSLWPAIVTFPIRDFVRVGLVDLDLHLVGEQVLPDSVEARAGIRPRVRPNADPVLIDNVDIAAAAVRAVLDGGGERHLVASVLEREWGTFPVAALPDAAAFPDALADPTVAALTGGGEADGDTVGKQRILVELTLGPELGPALAGAWARAWPHGFDDDTARHTRLNGGGAPVRADGAVTLVVELPPGTIDNSTRMGMDVLVATAAGNRFYADLRFDRPAPLDGEPIDIAAAQGPFLICETGTSVATAADLAGPNRVPPGATLVSQQVPPALVDTDSLPANQLTDAAIASQLTGGLSVALTEPAFANSPRGDDVGELAAAGATVEEVPRNGAEAVLEPGAALPAQERLEVAAARVQDQDVRGAIATAPPLAVIHESLPHQLAHPGVPATDEVHGTGAILTGPAAIPLVEIARDRTARSTLPDLFNVARNLLPDLPDPPGPVRWTALLRTVSGGVEGEPGLGVLAELSVFPFGQSLADMIAFFQSSPIGVPPGINANIPEAQAVARALDRRVATAFRGATDGLRSLRRALRRAEHFVYIETPAVDDLAIGDGGESPWSLLMEQMNERSGLHVLVCHPVHLMPGSPLRLEHVRNELLEKLPSTGEGRLELFTVHTGPSRSLRESSTTVIIDDAYAMTGTTHLWRRGLTFDSSLAVSMFDEQLERGRPREIRQLRQRLLAGRLGIELAQLPENPAELLLAIRQLKKRGGGHRLAAEAKLVPSIESTDDDLAAWNRDGTPGASLDGWLSDFLQLVLIGPVAEALGEELSAPSG